MVPVFVENHKEAIGFSINELHERFEAICSEHLNESRARAFGLIFYDFGDNEFQDALEDRVSFLCATGQTLRQQAQRLSSEFGGKGSSRLF